MKTVLIVDDSPTIRKLLAYILKKKSYIIAEAEDGMDAMEKLSHVQVDLVIVDLNMPNMDGIEFVKGLRDNYYYMDTPVIMLTTTKDEKLRKDAFEAGVNMFLNKPVQPGVLLYKVESFLQEGEDNERRDIEK
jgi:two-component system chemotaxis response regulator CheY